MLSTLYKVRLRKWERGSSPTICVRVLTFFPFCRLQDERSPELPSFALLEKVFLERILSR